MIAKTKRPQAERAAEWYLRQLEDCLHTRRAIRTQWQSVDFFGCDVVGLGEDGTKVWAQVTTGGYEALRVRRRKLETFPWHSSDTVLVLQLQKSTPRSWVFRVYQLHNRSYWQELDTCTVPSLWFKAYKKQNETNP